jgi:hypothetical protein
VQCGKRKTFMGPQRCIMIFLVFCELFVGNVINVDTEGGGRGKFELLTNNGNGNNNMKQQLDGVEH